MLMRLSLRALVFGGLGCLTLAALWLSGSAQVLADTAGVYPGASNAVPHATKFVSVSRTGGGIYLNAPYSIIKGSFSEDTRYYRFTFDAYQIPPAGSTEIQICGSNSAGDKDAAGAGCTSWMRPSSDISEILVKASGAPGSGIPAVDAPVDSYGYRNVYASFRRNTAGISGFKLNARGFTNSAFTTHGASAALGFAAGGDSIPMSMVNLPLTSASRSQYNLRFRTPCTGSGAGNFTIGWFDADRPPSTTPQDTQISWEIRNERTGQTLTSAIFAFYNGQNENAYLGGSDVSKSQAVENFGLPGDRYTWTWNGVLDNNGIQFYLPYPETDYYVDCPQDAECLVSGAGTNVPSTMVAGKQYDVSVVVANNSAVTMLNGTLGVTDWLGSGADNYSNATGVDPRTRRDNTHWQASQPPPSPTGPIRLKLPSYPVPGNSGLSSVRIVEFTVTAPSDIGIHPFWWQMVREYRDANGNVTGGNWYGTPCKKNIEVIAPENKPYVMINGGDVISGAAFTRNGQPCVPTADARNAHIRTNGYYGNELSVLNGSSMSQYAVFASGLIGDDSDYSARNNFVGNYGHKRQAAIVPKDGLFANKELSANQHGRFYGNPASGTLPCIDITQIEAASSSTAFTSSAQAEAYLESSESSTRTANTSVTLGSVLVPAGAKKTLIVNGDVTLTSSITYPGSYANVTQIPNLRIIAKGNIYLQTGVQTIDAHLVAYPQTAAAGILDTCSNVAGIAAGTWPTSLTLTTNSCKQNPSLVINGSITARRILWKRTNGTLGSSSTVADPTCYTLTDAFIASPTVDNAVARHRLCAAERIDFSAEAYLGQFSDGLLINPVPVNSIELPPIY